jgi:3-oxoadipate enol-lactonase
VRIAIRYTSRARRGFVAASSWLEQYLPMQTVSQRDESFALSDGTYLSYTLHAGRPAAPRLVLIHSLALDRTVWDGVVAELGDRAEILAYDCRGHGRSDRRAARYTAELFARDLAELLDHVGWQSATIAGCSMGGCVALAFGGLYPEKTAALGLIDTTAWYGPDAAAQFRDRAEAARAKGMEGLIDFQMTRWFSDAFRASNTALLQRTSATFVANNFDCYAASCGLLGDVDVRAHLPAFHMPVAIVVGEHDYATPVAMAQQLHEAIPHSRLTILPGARHLTPIERPNAIAGTILDLLNSGRDIAR